jgi:hypothetical protein
MGPEMSSMHSTTITAKYEAPVKTTSNISAAGGWICSVM